MSEVIQYKIKIMKVSKNKVEKVFESKKINLNNETSSVPYKKPIYLSGVSSIFPRPIEKPIEILPNGKFRVTLKKDSGNMKFFKTNLKEGCKCKNCWIQRNFELVTTI